MGCKCRGTDSTFSKDFAAWGAPKASSVVGFAFKEGKPRAPHDRKPGFLARAWVDTFGAGIRSMWVLGGGIIATLA
jgi:hypothetical protein